MQKKRERLGFLKIENSEKETAKVTESKIKSEYEYVILSISNKTFSFEMIAWSLGFV
jgi:hypothetical protein